MTVIECGRCTRWFRDLPDDCGVCPHCGHDNTEEVPA